MRIVHFTNTILSGGIESYVKRMAAAQAALGHSVTVIVFLRPAGDVAAITATLEAVGVSVFYIGARSGRDFFAGLRVRRLLRQIVPDILHLSSLPFALPWSLLGVRVPTILTMHIFTEDAVLGKMRFLSWSARRLVYGVIAVSHAQAKRERDELGFFRDAEWRVIHNGIDTQYFQPVARVVQPRGCRLSFVGRLAPDKGAADAVRVLAAMRSLRPDWDISLDMVGDGPLAAELRRVVVELGVSDQVRFHGQLADVRPILHAADLHLILSEKETFCYSALEAMACGVPVAAYPVIGGFAEVHSPGRTGVSSSHRDPVDLAGRVVALQEHATELATMRESARRHAESFAAPISVESTLEFYRCVVERVA